MNIHGIAKKINQMDFGCDIAEVHNVVSINAPKAPILYKYKMIASRLSCSQSFYIYGMRESGTAYR
jgi:hypothetical protein